MIGEQTQRRAAIRLLHSSTPSVCADQHVLPRPLACPMMDVLRKVAELGIKRCYLALYEERSNHEWCHLVLGTMNGRRDLRPDERASGTGSGDGALLSPISLQHADPTLHFGMSSSPVSSTTAGRDIYTVLQEEISVTLKAVMRLNAMSSFIDSVGG